MSNNELVPSSFLNKFFHFIERLVFKHSLIVIGCSLILAGLSIWVTSEKLTFRTGRGDLVAKGLPYVTLYKEYRKHFKDLEGMVIVAEGGIPSRRAQFAEILAT